MLRIRTGARHGLRWGVFGFVAAVLTISSDRTEAAPYSDIVVDANSGSVLHSTNPDSRRHPASLTKIMTLYLLFEQLEAGKLKLDSELAVSREAAGQDPTKLGLKPGGSLKVEDAIKGIVTRSANDAAVVVAEAIAGDEDSFAKLMTRKAQALGMSHTVYRNASGLPDDEQVTTARDQATLGRAIQERFPRYYKYFSTRSFTFRGDSIANHNRLLGRVDGVDGIKTGYISASGFNLVTSVHRGNRYLVAVVMGGSSAGSRDARMRELISDKIAQASTKRTAPMFAEAGETPEIEPKVARAEAKPERKVAAAASERKAEGKPEPKPDSKSETRFAVASASSVPVRFTPGFARAATGSTEPIKPVLVKTITVRAGTQTASLAPLQAASPPAAEPVQPTAPVVQVAAAMPTAPAKPQLPPAPAAAAKSEAAAPTPPATAQTRAGADREVRASGTHAHRGSRETTSPQRLDDPGRRLPGRAGGQAASRGHPGQGGQGAQRCRCVHRDRREGRRHLLARPLRRARQGQGGSRLQISQAQRRRLRDNQELTSIRTLARKQGTALTRSRQRLRRVKEFSDGGAKGPLWPRSRGPRDTSTPLGRDAVSS